MRRWIVVAALLIAACSHGPKAPPLHVEITRLGVTLDATGWVVSEDKDISRQPTLLPTDSPDRWKTAENLMGNTGFGSVRTVSFGPFPKGSGLVTMEDVTINSFPLIEPGPTLEKCAAKMLEYSKGHANEYHLRVPQAPINLHGIDAIIWEDEVNFLAGAGPNSHRILLTMQKGSDCLELEASANVPNYDKVKAKLHATLETLAPTSGT